MRSLTVVLMMASMAACDTAASPTPPAVTVVSDRLTYRSGETAMFAVRNGSQDSLYVTLCSSVIERAAGTTWVRHDSFACGLSLPNDDSIAAPGRTVNVELAGHFVRDLAPGTFRLRLRVITQDGVLLPDSLRTSNSFNVLLTGGE